MTPADLVHDWSAGTFTCPLCREVLHGRDRTDLCPTRVTRALATARAEADADGYARGRADGLREAAESDRLLSLIEEWTHDGGSQYVPTGGDADTFGDGVRRAQSRVRNILNTRRALAPHPEPTPGPRVGDPVTAENVGALPVGTVVRWEHLGEEWRAERVAANLWCAGGIEHDDEEIADEGGPVTTIASLPRVGGGGS